MARGLLDRQAERQEADRPERKTVPYGQPDWEADKPNRREADHPGRQTDSEGRQAKRNFG